MTNAGGWKSNRIYRAATDRSRLAERPPARLSTAVISVADDAAGAEGGFVREVEALFSPQGPFSQSRNFEFRPQQQRMAMAVAQALARGEHLVVEAGTGVGKSFAYLAPALLYAVRQHKKAIISTHTINLQEQLIEKDLPVLAKALPVEFAFTMLKGRANYLCTLRLQRALQQSASLFTSPEAAELKRIWEWSQSTTDGSLSDFDLEPNPAVWAHVCSERGLCSPKRCGPGSEFAKAGQACFFQRARQRILGADLVVLNHTLFFTLLGSADEEPGSGVLFKNDFVIFDEAHTVESVAARHAGLSVGAGQVRFALQRLWNPRTEKGLFALLRQADAVRAAAEALGEAEGFFRRVEEACEGIVEGAAGGAAGRDDDPPRGGGRAWKEIRIRRPDLVTDTLTLPLARLRERISEMVTATDNKEAAEELQECGRRLAELRLAVQSFLQQSAEDHVYWVERSGKSQSVALNASPVDVAEYLRRRLFSARTSVVLTSATLGLASPQANADGVEQTGRSPLDYVVRRVGAETAMKLQLGSPFDFESQMKVYIAAKMPDPRDAGYEDALAKWIGHFVRQTQGRAFVLFTNLALLRRMGDRLEREFSQLGLECLVQGGGSPRSTLLDRFRRSPGAVLFGAASFWQGVDVPGEALSNVIITRLPFAAPDHPLIEASLERIEARGGNPFSEFSLPEAILRFRQGVGRLIRTRTDRGIVAVLDNRVLTKRYGRAFLEAIPRCPVEIV